MMPTENLVPVSSFGANYLLINAVDDFETASTAIRNQFFIGTINMIKVSEIIRNKTTLDCFVALRATGAPFTVFTPIS